MSPSSFRIVETREYQDPRPKRVSIECKPTSCRVCLWRRRKWLRSLSITSLPSKRNVRRFGIICSRENIFETFSESPFVSKVMSRCESAWNSSTNPTKFDSRALSRPHRHVLTARLRAETWRSLDFASAAEIPGSANISGLT